MTENMKLLKGFSDGISEAAQAGSSFTVLVDGRRGYPSSGVFYGTKYVLASNHAVHADEGVLVEGNDGASFEAKVVGRDQIHDIVLLELNQERNGETPVSEDAVTTGQLALVLARPSPDGVQASLGVVGVADGTYIGGHGPALKGMIRTDAEQFPGFSGGPLIDVEGKLIGINIMGRRHGSFLTLPAARAFAIAEKIIEKGDIRQAYLGIRSQPADLPEDSDLDQEYGLLIVNVENESPAALAKLMTGDILVGIAGTAVTSPGQLLDVLADHNEGDEVDLDVLRGGTRTTIKVTLGGRDFESHRRHKGPRGKRAHRGHPHRGHPHADGRRHKHGR